MADKMEILLTLNLKQFLKSLGNVKKEIFGISENDIDLSVNDSEFQEELESARSKIDSLADAEIEIDGDASGAVGAAADAENEISGIDGAVLEIDGDAGGVVAAAADAEGAIDGVPESHTVNFDADISNLESGIEQAQNGLNNFGGIAQGIFAGLSFAVIGKTASALVDFSNVQEQAEQGLRSALDAIGENADIEVEKLKNLASEVQNVTTVGDEQSLALLTLATNMGIAADKREEALKGAIGLSTAFASAGLSEETAMKGVALAYQGNFSQLERYIPALRTAETETEKMAILQNAMANGFDMAKAEAETGAGQMEQFSNLVGDLKEKFGDLIKEALIPVVSVLANVAKWLNDNKEIFVSVAGAVGVFAIAIAALSAKMLIFNLIASANPIGLIVAAIVALVAGIAIAIKEVGGFANAFELLKAGILGAWEYIKAFAKFLFSIMKTITDYLVFPYKVLWKTASSVFRNIGEIIKNVFSGNFAAVTDNIKSMATDIMATAKDEFVNMKNNLQEGLGAFSQAAEKSKEIWQDAVDKTGIRSQEQSEEVANAAENAAGAVDSVSDSVNSLPATKKVDIVIEEKRISDDEGESEDLEFANVDESLAAVEERRKRYYENMRFQDADYYEWKKEQIANEAENLMLGEEEKALYQKTKMEELDAEKQAYLEKLEAKTGMEMLISGKLNNQIASDTMAMSKNFKDSGKVALKASVDVVTAKLREAIAAQIAKIFSSMPFPINIGLAAAAGAVVGGIMNQAISSILPKFATGGEIGGKSHAQGGTVIEAEKGEYIINKNRVAELGKGFFDFVNFGNLQAVKEKVSDFGSVALNSISAPTPQFQFAAGGAVESNSNFLGIENRLDKIYNRLGTLENQVYITNSVETDAISLANEVRYGMAELDSLTGK